MRVSAGFLDYTVDHRDLAVGSFNIDCRDTHRATYTSKSNKMKSSCHVNFSLCPSSNV